MNLSKNLRLVTRKSKLALWQAEFVKAALCKLHPELEISIIGVSTAGDKILDTPLNKIGGKGLFVKELEEHLLNKTADIAVHSMKDLPAELPPQLEIAAILKRADARDVLVSDKFGSLADLPKGAVVGTSSLRRQAQLAELRPDLKLEALRGNVDTRIQKLFRGEFDAEILAFAGLQRLELTETIREYFSPEQMLPAVGQGALGIECRKDDFATKALLTNLHHPETAFCVLAERSMNAMLGGSCQLPVAGFAEIEGNRMVLKDNVTRKTEIEKDNVTWKAALGEDNGTQRMNFARRKKLNLRGMVAEPDGHKILRASVSGVIRNMEDAEKIGQTLAQVLLEQGALEIISKLS